MRLGLSYPTCSISVMARSGGEREAAGVGEKQEMREKEKGGESEGEV